MKVIYGVLKPGSVRNLVLPHVDEPTKKQVSDIKEPSPIPVFHDMV